MENPKNPIKKGINNDYGLKFKFKIDENLKKSEKMCIINVYIECEI